jgi:hypothetical protein
VISGLAAGIDRHRKEPAVNVHGKRFVIRTRRVSRTGITAGAVLLELAEQALDAVCGGESSDGGAPDAPNPEPGKGQTQTRTTTSKVWVETPFGMKETTKTTTTSTTVSTGTCECWRGVPWK